MQEVFEKIIENLRAAEYNHAVCGKDMAIDTEKAVQIVEDVCEEYNSGWIYDRLPKEKETVIACTVNSSFAGCYFCGEWYRENMFCYDSMIREPDVIAWQFLPQPYEPKEEEKC